MNIDLTAAAGFLATHARVLDRRRFQLLIGEPGPAAALAALDGYRNPDGGYGWGLEPDLRSPESQPGAALHAFEVFEDSAQAVTGAPATGAPATGAPATGAPATGAPATGAPATGARAAGARAAALCDWLASVSRPDGGLPFALPLTVTAGTAHWWAGADHAVSSLQVTAAVAAGAHRVGRHYPAVAGHPWLDRATRYCLAAIESTDETPHAYVLSFAVRFLDAVHDARPEAAGLLQHLGKHIPASGQLPVAGGTAEEMLRPLDFAPFPGRPARSLFTAAAVTADLDRLAGLQQDDGGWTVDFAEVSPAGALEWRGYATVSAIGILRRNARI